MNKKNMTQKLIILALALLASVKTQAQQNTESDIPCDVGEIPYQYTMTPTGAVTYQIPIDIYPDAEEVQPHLSFDYNSMQRESIMGYGWNIGGLSGITHVSGSIFYDGQASPLSLKDDKLMLDGGRLMKIGTNEWQSEQGFVKVKKETDGSLSVRYPNGSKARYETSPSAPFSYVMTLYTSRNGRSVKYLYEQADRLPYICKVMYGESNGVYNDSIVFTYRDVEAPITHYIDNLSFKHSRLLEKVESFYKGRLWKRYKLSYENRDVNLPVQLDCETDNGRLRPLQFKYGVGRSIEFLSERSILLEKYFKNSVQGPGAHKSLALSRGKFSRNAQSDGLISYPLLGNYAETQQLLVYKDLSDTYVAPVVFTAGKGFKQLEALDVNGDGLEEPVKVNYADSKLSVSVYTNEIDPNRHSDYTYTEGSGYVHERQIISGDFNGDGKVELLAISSCYDSDKRKHPSRALLIDLNNRQTLYDGECFDFTLHQVDKRAVYPDRMLTMDYNGDGKTDICVINVYGLYVYEFSGKGFYQLAYSDAINIMHFNFESNTSKDRELMVADMNGDGSMDIVLGPRRVHCKDGFKHLGDGLCHGACTDENNLVSTSASGYKRYVHPYSKQECTTDPSTPVRDLITFDWNVKDGKQWTFLISTGNSSYSREKPGFKVHTEELFYCFHETVGLNFMLMDIDNDGLPDLLRNARGKIYLHLNKNGKISQEYNYRSVLQMDNPSAQFAVANVAQSYYWSGSLICVDNEKLHTYHYNHNESKERLLHELKDSYGITSKHYYMDLMEMSGNNYISQPDASLEYISYPYTIMTPHLFVPSWTKKVQSGKDLSWEYYTYTHAVFHRTGLGFRGFRKIQTKDAINNRTMISVFDPELLCAETRKETPTDTITRTYVLERAQNKTALLKLMKETVKDALNGTEKSTSYEYNAYGQPTSTSTSQGIRLSDNQTSDYLNVENDDIYLLGLPLFKQKQTVRRDSVFTQEEKTEYNEYYLPARKDLFINGNCCSKERYTYNAHHQLIKKEQCSYESTNWLTTQMEYNTEGWLSKETNPMGQTTVYTYDTATGLLQHISDAKGRTTQYIYDPWGRLTHTLYPDGRKKEVRMEWSTDGEPGIYRVTESETGKPTLYTYFDSQKREVRTAQLRFDGRMMKTDKVYNEQTGLLEKESLPSTDSIPSRWNRYVHDKYRRRTSTHYASGKVDSCAYGALTDTIFENGIRHIHSYDVTGKMTQATDAAGSISYFYRPDGQPLVAMMADGTQTRFYYDKYARRTAIKDPSAGIRYTEYDAAGNVYKETDADGRSMIKEYDLYGRVVKQQADDITTVYTYDNAENLLLSAVSDNGCALHNTYDAYGRLKTQREEAPDGVWLQKEYTYTTDGLPASIAYSSQNGVLTTEQLTYRNGFLTEVQLTDGTIVYRHDEENERGQLTKLTTGTMQRLYEFDEWGLPVRRSITKSDRSILLDQRYQFDVKTGNLTKRTDAQRNLIENFGYDALNRLTSYGNYSVTYGDNGNILRKGDAGELAYTNPNRPYAVTGWSPTDQQKAPDETSITYTAGERPSIIRQEAKQAVLTYNAQHDRVRMQYAVNDSIHSTHYYLSGNYEMKKTLADMKEILYLGGGYYEAPAVYVKEGQKTDIYFIHRDYLGSILQLADRKGNLVEENSFDAWGCRRNPATQQPYAEGKAPELLLGRGFTGHEHLSFFGLVNMNARLYDPLLGRFLSPDPYVQFLDYTQAFNRYSYCMNSPLCYVDENGEILGWIIGAAIIGGIVNVATHWKNIDNFWQGLGYFGVGAVAGTVGAATGGAVAGAGFIGGAIGGFVGGASSGFITGFGNTLVEGGNFANALYAGAGGALYGAVSGAAGGAIIGGGISFFKGQNVWSGKEIAPGRNPFSLKNTPINSIEHPEIIRFSIDDAVTALPEDPLLNNINKTPMSNYDKGQLGVKEAMREFIDEGGVVHATEVSVDVPDGVGRFVRNRFDFVGELDGKLHLFEIKNGPKAGFTSNQKINLPKFILNKTQFIPVGEKAIQVPGFIRNVPYTKDYIIIIKHYF